MLIGSSWVVFYHIADRTPAFGALQLRRASTRRGQVKWYNAAKGLGFIVLAGDGKDVFVHASALERAGITVCTRASASLSA